MKRRKLNQNPTSPDLSFAAFKKIGSCRINKIAVSVLLLFSWLLYACSNDNGATKFLGHWKGKETYVEISKSGDYYLWNDGGNLFGKLQFKYANGELQSGGHEGNVTYNKENGHIYFFGREFEKMSDDGWKKLAEQSSSDSLKRYQAQGGGYMSDRDSIEYIFMMVSNRLDSINTADPHPQLFKLKSQIGNILRKKDVTETEFQDAKKLIQELNSKIDKAKQ
jgi:hypothetical protein